VVLSSICAISVFKSGGALKASRSHFKKSGLKSTPRNAVTFEEQAKLEGRQEGIREVKMAVRKEGRNTKQRKRARPNKSMQLYHLHLLRWILEKLVIVYNSKPFAAIRIDGMTVVRVAAANGHRRHKIERSGEP
jgi:hypothetical protein